MTILKGDIPMKSHKTSRTVIGLFVAVMMLSLPMTAMAAEVMVYTGDTGPGTDPMCSGAAENWVAVTTGNALTWSDNDILSFNYRFESDEDPTFGNRDHAGIRVTGGGIAQTAIVDATDGSMNPSPPLMNTTGTKTAYVRLSCGGASCTGDLEIYAANASNCWTDSALWVDDATVSTTGTPATQRLVSIADESNKEENNPITFTVSLDQSSGSDITISYTTVDGTATAPSDYDTTTGTVTIEDGDTSATFDVELNDNNDQPPNEYFTVVLTGVVSGPGTILDGTGIGWITQNDNTRPVWNAGVPYEVWIDEFAPDGTLVTTGWYVSDPDPLPPENTLTYTITGGDPKAGDLVDYAVAFEIDSATGGIRVKTSSELDYTKLQTETGNDYFKLNKVRVDDAFGQRVEDEIWIHLNPITDIRAFNDDYHVAEGGTLTVSLPAAGLLGNDATDPPTAANEAVTTDEDIAHTFSSADFSAGYTDQDGDAFAGIRLTSIESAGDLEFNGSDVVGGEFISTADLTAGRLVFTPGTDENGSPYATFGFVVYDGTNWSTSAYTMTIDVTPINDKPTADDQPGATATEDVQKMFTLTGADNDPELSQTLTYIITALPATGSLRDEAASAVIGPGDLPFALTDDDVYFITALHDTGGQNFQFKVNDGGGGTEESDPATVTIAITAVNDSPTAADESVGTNEDTAISFTAGDFSASYADVEGDLFAGIRLTSIESAGDLEFNGGDVVGGEFISEADLTAGRLVFTPVADENGSPYATFGFVVYDGTDWSASAYTMTVDVTPVNDKPTADDQPGATATEDVQEMFTLTGDDSDPELSQTLTYIISALPATGSLRDEAASAVIGPGDLPFALTDDDVYFTTALHDTSGQNFQFKVNDGGGGTEESDAATVTIAVTPVNDAPVAVDDHYSVIVSYTTDEDTPKTFNNPGNRLLDNDTDVEGDVLEVTAPFPTATTNGAVITVSSGSKGSFTYNPAGSATIQALDAGDTLDDTFTYSIYDDGVPSETSNTATATIRVTGVNDDPNIVSVDDPVTDDEGNLVTINITITDVDSSSWTYWVDWDGDGLNDGGDEELPGETSKTVALTHTYTDDFSGTIDVTVTDNNGGSDGTTSVVTISNVNPVADAGLYAIDEGQDLVLDGSGTTDAGAGDSLSYAWDLDNDAVYDDALGVGPTVLWADIVALGLSSDGTAHTIGLQVTDDDGGSHTATTTLTINNLSPLAAHGGAYTIDEGQDLVLDGSGSSDPGGDSISYAWELSGDALYDDATGATPTVPWATLAGFGLASDGSAIPIGLEVTDPEPLTNVAITNLTINNLAPTANAGGPYTIDEGDDLVLAGSGSDPNPNETLTYSWDLNNDGTFGDAGLSADSGTVTWAQLGALAPPVNNDGSYNITLRVSDDVTSTDSTVTVTITNVAPTANAGGPYTINEGDDLVLSGSGGDANANDTLTYEWDLNGDADFTDATGASPTVTWAQLQALGIDNEGSGTMTLRVSDDDTSTTDSTTGTMLNVAPSADANTGAAYSISEGDDLVLAGSGSDPNSNDTLTYTWDINGDGTFGDAGITASTGTVTWAQLIALGINDTGSPYNVVLRVFDGVDTTDSAAEPLTVANTAPSADANTGAAYSINEGDDGRCQHRRGLQHQRRR